MVVLVTGCAGFIGYHVARRLLDEGFAVIGLDNLNDYYDPTLKKARLKRLGTTNFIFHEADLKDAERLEAIFNPQPPEIVVHMAAQAGVRYSMENPDAYVSSNLIGFFHVLEMCRKYKVRHLIYASSSSVYGANTRTPYTTREPADHPVSLYSATKRSNELMAHAYSHLYGLPTTGLRLFTVYGPWGRPDMAPFLFTKAILEGRPIRLYYNGRMKRDFTYIDDSVECIYRLVERIPEGDTSWSGDRPDPSGSRAPYKIYNIGGGRPVVLTDFVDAIERELGMKAEKELWPLQPGEVTETSADVRDLANDIGYVPSIPIEEGVKRFIRWYKEYYVPGPASG